MIITILVLSWTTLTAQTRDDRIREVVSNYIYLIDQQSNTISALDNELSAKNMILTNIYRVMETQGELHTVDLKLERIKSAKQSIISGSIGAGAMAVVIVILKSIFR